VLNLPMKNTDHLLEVPDATELAVRKYVNRRSFIGGSDETAMRDGAFLPRVWRE